MKAPPCKYRVVGVDTFEGPLADYVIGNFTTTEEAIAAAKNRAEVMNSCYVYDSEGNPVANFGTP